MFVKKSWSQSKGKKHFTYEIVESYRPAPGKNPRTRKIANITHLPLDMIAKIRRLLKNPDAKIIDDTSSVFRTSFVLGPLLVIYLVMRQMGICDVLKCLPKVSRLLLIGVIINRILDPRSKLGSVSWIKKTAFSFMFGIDTEALQVNAVYRAMDVLYERLDELMDDFFRRNSAGGVRLLLYDITSIYFEGKGPQGIAFNGYSRDKRPDRPQIILCLCLNERKLPIFFEVLAGNITDKTTVIPLIKKLKQRFSIQETIFIGDRGMVSQANIDFMEREEGLDYIIALSHSQARQILFDKVVNQLDVFQQELPVTVYREEEILDTNNQQHSVTRKYVLCGSPYRREHDVFVLNRLLEKGRKALESVQKMVEQGRLKDHDKVIRRAQKKLTQTKTQHFYDFAYANGVFTLLERTENIARAQALCGHYLLKTTVSEMADTTVEEQYKQLQVVERAFRDVKDWIEIRPIFHYKERRVKSHIFLSLIAQSIASSIRDVLKSHHWLQAEVENSCDHFLDKMNEIKLGILHIEDKDEQVISYITPEHKKFIRMFGFKIGYFTNREEMSKLCRLR